MRIVIVEGLWRYGDRLERVLCTGLREQFPGADICPENIWGCWPTQTVRMRQFIEHLAEKYDDGEETLFLGHSMGGIFACALDGRLQNTRMIGIVTICSPHSYLSGVFPYVLGAGHRLSAPIITFEARHDILVRWGSCHPQSREHIVLDCDHREDLIRDPRHVRRIVEVTKRHFA